MSEASVLNVPKHVSKEHVFDFDIYNDARLAGGIHTGYASLRAEAPRVFYTPANGGHWIVMEHDAIAEVVKDFEHFSAKEMQIPRIDTPPVFIPLSLDPPANMPYRQLLMPIFSPKSVAAMDPGLKEFAAELIDAVAASGECDFVHSISSRFPVGVFMRLMGMPWERLEMFRELADHFSHAVGSEAIGAATAPILMEMEKVLDEHRAEPKDDLISHLLTAEIAGKKLTQSELMSVCFLLFLAGLDTVTNVMSFGCRQVAGDPALQARLRSEPALIEPFVEEIIRLFGVVNSPRLVVKDIEKFGVQFREGDMVLCALPMAGYDTQKNDDPTTFNIDRKQRTHLTFSTGPHLCLGHFLARSELKTLFRAWFDKIPEFSVAPDDMPTYRAGLVMAMQSLKLRWNP